VAIGHEFIFYFNALRAATGANSKSDNVAAEPQVAHHQRACNPAISRHLRRLRVRAAAGRRCGSVDTSCGCAAARWITRASRGDFFWKYEGRARTAQAPPSLRGFSGAER
jgi:hypothetical protein